MAVFDPSTPLPCPPTEPLQPLLHQAIVDAPRQEQIAAHDRTARTLSYCVTLGFFALIVAVTAIALLGRDLGPVSNLLFTLLGVVATGWTTIINFHFGTSASSAQKSTTINTALTQAMTEKGAA